MHPFGKVQISGYGQCGTNISRFLTPSYTMHTVFYKIHCCCAVKYNLLFAPRGFVLRPRLLSEAKGLFRTRLTVLSV
jgi:hypothetical protein